MKKIVKPIVHVCIPSTRHDFFDYHAEGAPPQIGVRVWVPFGAKKRMGIVVGHGSHSTGDFAIKTILETIDETPVLSEELLRLCQWVSSYYQAALSEVLPLSLPKKLRSTPSGRPQNRKANHTGDCLRFGSGIGLFPKSPPPTLTSEQEFAVAKICQTLSRYHCFLLEGVTGSGKTEVYLQCIEKVLQKGRQVLVIAPEIGLTPQLLSRFRARFDVPMSVLHSELSDTLRHHVWQGAKMDEIKLVIGTRGSVFTPMPNLGLIVIDEEHDPSLKQMDRVRYSARDTALMRAYFTDIPIILGSATPSLESLQNCHLQKYTRLQLTHKAMTPVPLRYQLLDIRNIPLRGGLAPQALALIEAHLEKQHQILIFINRRGYSPVLLCHQCGYMADCKACDAHLTLHRKTKQLICHHCGLAQAIPTNCKQCSSKELVPVGVGTQRIFETLAEEFPQAKMLRVDRDETRQKNAMDASLDKIHRGEVQLIVGTQMLAKGHHFPRMTLVVVLDTDNAFYNQDFRAIERLGQLLTQVAGRAGREALPGHVLIQTHLPQHPLLNLLIQQGYPAFAGALLSNRKEAALPPFSFLALLHAQSKSVPKLLEFLHKVKQHLQKEKIEILGPAPAPLARKANYHRMQLLIKSRSRKQRENVLNTLRNLIRHHQWDKSIQWNIDIDPIDLS